MVEQGDWSSDHFVKEVTVYAVTFARNGRFNCFHFEDGAAAERFYQWVENLSGVKGAWWGKDSI